jgi:pyoverdine/dityrosine biosynthesis protein Dit1/AcrR family transcriptional regulator
MRLATVNTSDRRSRQRVLEAAVSLLAERGLRGELLVDAAVRAECPLSRARLYFRRDEDLILALYARLAAELEARVPDLPEATLAERFRLIMQAKLALVTPYRDALAALLSTLLDPRHELGVLSAETELIRTRVMGVFSAVLCGASDRQKLPVHQSVHTLYAAHLALMLFWTQDRTPDSQATRTAIDFTCELLTLSKRLSWLPGFGNTLAKVDEICAPLVEPAPDEQATRLAKELLQHLFRYRRLQPGAGACAQSPCEQCLALHLPKVRRFVLAGEPLHLLLPAFPAKSPSLRKVLGPLPDMAEELALSFLENICDELREIYSPGARITICSDGRAFSDLVGVTDEQVTAYALEVSNLLERVGAASIELFSMEDLFDSGDQAAMREQLCVHYADSLQAIKERAHAHSHHLALFNGIQRFLFEDRVAIEPGKSRTQVRNECKERAYQVIRRSDAWGRLVGECFPAALRLSIHPQAPHSDKIGILLGEANDAWLTPWHGVAVHTGGRFKLMKRAEAEALGAHTVERMGRPYYFETGGGP